MVYSSWTRCDHMVTKNVEYQKAFFGGGVLFSMVSLLTWTDDNQLAVFLLFLINNYSIADFLVATVNMVYLFFCGARNVPPAARTSDVFFFVIILT